MAIPPLVLCVSLLSPLLARPSSTHMAVIHHCAETVNTGRQARV